MGVAQFNSFSALPTALHLSGDGELQPIRLYYGELRLKKGGKVDKASAMKKAGRNGDTELIHVNKEELAELVKMWGPPSINPETGLPEFFLKKVWKKVKKIAKPLASIAQMALPFIPGIGPIASVALGAGLGGITGGVKGALGGAASGAIGGGLAGKLGTKVGIGKMGGNALVGALGGAGSGVKGMAAGALTGGIAGGLGEQLGAKLPGNMDPRMKTALANGLLGGLAAGVGGGNPMLGMLGTGMTSYMTNQGQYGQNGIGGKTLPTGGVVDSATPLDDVAASNYGVAAPNADLSVPKGLLSNVQRIGAPSKGQLAMAAAAGAASAAPSAKKSKKADPWASLMTDPTSFLPATFNAKLPDPNGIYKNLGRKDMSGLSEDYWNTAGERGAPAYFNYVNGYAKGGEIKGGKKAPKRESFAVQGPGTGRSDHVPAMLSDGEYVVDAETVAMLGDGSSKAGAQRLDQMRVNLRKHKGRNLSRGRFSANAKKPEAYMRGGRV